MKVSPAAGRPSVVAPLRAKHQDLTDVYENRRDAADYGVSLLLEQHKKVQTGTCLVCRFKRILMTFDDCIFNI